ncbi:class I SAM-dependent methyltransferase [Actinocrispum wychmicini]|uniref:Ubiquinone/menaquinone biosynthesis C-methylase UbiE n=1 Tax=Actinocrispum wychmicini TaxID=1213861 RepID=A0A4R2JR10_9PSEU|nr:class I SAM-dependent methyltransferase [Actinocrispum wychmicini]TCO59646.1 ubiquinone/menaquinone biosynthesis C-methylase UbiE [Actinocrispum wychmicini]
MTSTRFDPARFKATQRANWNAMSAGWLTWREKFERGGTPVSERLLELGEVRPGHRVLDVGTGIGEPAVLLANTVGEHGRVTALDLSEEMVEIARARSAALGNVDVLRGDLESLDLPAGAFDALISRWGLMFAVDHRAAFAEAARVLVPGGRLAASVWGPPETAPMISRGFRVLAERLELPQPPPEEPSPYSMSDPAQVERELRAAGFAEVSVTGFDAPFWLTGTDEYVEFYRTCSPPGLLTMIEKRFGSKDDPDTWAAIAASVEPYRRPDGRIDLPSRTLLVRAVTPLS